VSIAEDFSARRVNNRYASVRNVSQVQVRLERPGNDAFKTIQRDIIDWMGRKAGRAMPVEAWEGHSFELDEVGAQRVAASELLDPRYWAARVDDADGEVARRTWTTEIGLAPADNGAALLGCRLIVSARGENPPYEPTIPAFIRQSMRSSSTFLDGRLLPQGPWIVRSRDDVSELYSLLVAPKRRCDVCLYSLDEDQEDPFLVMPSANVVYHRTLGVAHIAVITGSAAYYLTDFVGKEFSVFNRAVRTYRPQFNIDNDEPRRHPVAFAQSIFQWKDGSIEGVEAFENFLIRNLISQTVATTDLERNLPSFTFVRRIASQSVLEEAEDAGAPQEQMLTLLKQDNLQLRQSLEEEKELHDGLLTEADIERAAAERREEEAKSENYSLKQRVRALEVRLQSKDVSDLPSALPDDLSNLKQWADKNLAGSVFLTNRALRGAKDSEYSEPSFIYESLLLLRDHYVPMRRQSGTLLSEQYTGALAELWLEDAISITPNRLGEQGDEYLILYNGKKRELSRHLKKGSSRDPRYCFRLYFFWDEEDEQAVVGWLPSHLDTRTT
jgi:hypothetical protein